MGFFSSIKFCHSETSIVLKKKAKRRRDAVFLPARKAGRRQVLYCLSRIKGACKKSMVGAWVCISVRGGRERTAAALGHPKFHAPTYRGHARNAATTHPVWHREIHPSTGALHFGDQP